MCLTMSNIYGGSMVDLWTKIILRPHYIISFINILSSFVKIVLYFAQIHLMMSHTIGDTYISLGLTCVMKLKIKKMCYGYAFFVR